MTLLARQLAHWRSRRETRANLARLLRYLADVTVHLPMAIHPTERERSFDHVLDALLQRKRELARSALWPPVTAKSDVSQMMKAILGPGQPTLALDPPPRPPELLCRRTLDGWSWTLALETPAELGIDEVLFDGEPLERSDEEWEISSCVGELHAKTANSRVHPIELFAGRPLIFKTAPDWDGPGRRCRGVSRSGRCRASSCPATTSEGEQGPRRHWSSPHPQVHWEA